MPHAVKINRRFARSARLDTDLQSTPSLAGYVLQPSVAKSLQMMAASQLESKQGAFTWTGPYGGGKSSAALLVANLIASEAPNRKLARKIAGRELAALYDKSFPAKSSPWAVVAVTGRRAKLRQSIAEAASYALQWDARTQADAASSNEALIDALVSSAESKFGGVALILDELGKMLEHEAATGGDIHLLQDLAECSSRSDGRFVIIGILHQAFEQYAARISREARQEWAKVQGRFQDLPFLAGADETVGLLARAITSEHRPNMADALATCVATAVADRKPANVESLSKALAETWPLNPVTALLLGPLSRQRFAQNERSVFGFLSSEEPGGFQQFLRNSVSQETYDPDQLWDYLIANFGMALTAGADGNRYSLAFEAVERAAAKGSITHVRLTKSAAALEFFRSGTGLAVSDDFLRASLPDLDNAVIDKAVSDLVDWAVLIRQPRLGGYALFAGSDFDLEEAIGREITPLSNNQLASLPQKCGLGFTTAKRHYFRTGALRTFDVILQQVGADDDATTNAARIAEYRFKGAGLLALISSDGSIGVGAVEARAKAVCKILRKKGVVAAVGIVSESFALRSSATELFAVEQVARENPQLEGDRIARRELAARQSATSDLFHRELEAALDRATWCIPSNEQSIAKAPVSIIASALADAVYPHSPLLHSELLQRDKPSSSAMAAVRSLCYAMVERSNEEGLGFSGFPAEMGLYLTVLTPFGLHRRGDEGNFEFHAPDESPEGRSLQPAWEVIVGAGEVKLDEVYATWAKPPYGIKAGVMPVLALSVVLAMRHTMAVYLDGVFQTSLDDVFVDKLLQRPGEIRLRRIERDTRATAFIDDLASRFGLGKVSGSLPVAQALFQRYEQMTAYAQRTEKLSDNAKKVRQTVLRARDPEALLRADLPKALGGELDANRFFDALIEAENAYPDLLVSLKQALATALAVDVDTFAGLRERASTVKGLTNDFAFEGFAMRAAAFEDGEGDIEGVASVLVHKPARSWSDRDREQAFVQMARYGQQFRELEALAVVRDRKSNTEALALVVGVNADTPPVHRSFVLTEDERAAAAELADRVLGALRGEGSLNRIQLAALARAVEVVAGEKQQELI